MNSYHLTVNQPIIFISLWTEISVLPDILRNGKVDEDCVVPKANAVHRRHAQRSWPRWHFTKSICSHASLKQTNRHPSNKPSTPKHEKLQGLYYYILETYEKFGNQENNSFFRALFLVFLCLANIHFHFLVQFSFYFLFQSPLTSRNIIHLYKDDILWNENPTRQLNIN